MLQQISSDVFLFNGNKKDPVDFHYGLNVIQGDDEGSNSIGKTTMLMIIDFAFGGDDYILKMQDVVLNVKEHHINFSFKFDGVVYYYSRGTSDYKVVYLCDKDYNRISTISIDEYKNFLFKNYQIDLPNITFRGVVSKFFRIYGRENLNENLPLKSAENEKVTDQIINLLKLYNHYSEIVDLQNLVNNRKEEKRVFTKAQKHNLISKVTKAELKKIEKEIVVLINKRDSLSLKSTNEIFGINSDQAEVISELKSKLTASRRNRGYLKSRLKIVENNQLTNNPNFKHNLTNLKRFFPDANLKTIQETELFHQEITNHLSKLYIEEKKHLNNLIQLADEQITQIESEIKEQGISSKVSYSILQEYSKVITELERLYGLKKSFMDLENLTTEIKSLTSQLETLQIKKLSVLQQSINQEMECLNDYVYGNNIQHPVLSITKPNKYLFSTPNDTGTGVAYKGLILFDLASLNLTPLPAIIHDSILFKNIATAPVERIFKLYALSKKQVFVAFDKVKDYSLITQQIINTNTVLKLTVNGSQLFGKSWNGKRV